ncbi:MAG: hypothetical protein A3A96_00570 [Candidatus Zambryskibacteria bacterium RIFCSPLOWO2_01_FULL_39_39]|uniref:Trimeric autotransporter adhesin YadA-like head domain-containing protein n=1 Tax=Candidatus Zambryskibacteria bacterium RIFCSPLOWO2_01_FULL_39_39 TaxID=1802758 RepID=A0A1G2TZ69_9BACT|nr:MAG: hypothetical protein UT00_C0004G0009 [Parcubacteria group bacterium GW2011_GWA1_38_7]OHA87798.1 MAG: hypothetical protein A2644_01325 [Candidatus Zambryskibacteria bacterium RIFCSPHIGHO2_01_FULL_39_63]OHA94977.1 MAG: hypothetical protein A3B88_01190 [Candidatus Zambryskibacteria bacterium RIFCSPHIGHO2_02_FULL_39_19]OHA99158.1 MAG: hypothetical protein A3F20_03140 [Candidatus Zambryskibacteria bacterium RIFCSPHIGHO2_12_FULL_39_21]OHB01920.1 MAG: hypothetical protein A3A96_00570 [Candidat
MKKLIKSKILMVLIILMIFIFPTTTSAVIQSLNGQSGQTQLFANDANITINSASNTHSLGWSGFLPVSRGGTGASSFTNGSILFSNGTSITQNNSNLFWDNITHSLTIGGNLNIGNNIVAGNLSGTNTGDQNLSGLVPYTGATGPVNLGVFDLMVNGITAGKGPNSGGSNDNTAFGAKALDGNTTGSHNTAIGNLSLTLNQGGVDNVAVGHRSMQNNTSGVNNTAVGSNSAINNVSGNENTSIGALANYGNSTGHGNTSIGTSALRWNNGVYNVAVGVDAGREQADGTTQLTSADNSIYIGFGARGYDNSDDNSIVIGHNAIGAGANKAVIGNSNVTDVYFGSSSGNANLHAANICVVSSGSSAPSSTPAALGQMYIDTSATKVYISTGTSSSSDWTLMN